MRWPPTGSMRYRGVLRRDPLWRRQGDPGVAPPSCIAQSLDRAEIERELAFFRKHRQRMRYHALIRQRASPSAQACESSAANKTLVTQRHRSAPACSAGRIAGGQAVLTFRRPDQIRSLRPGMEGHHRRNSTQVGQRQHQSLCRSIAIQLPELLMNEAPGLSRCHTRLVSGLTDHELAFRTGRAGERPVRASNRTRGSDHMSTELEQFDALLGLADGVTRKEVKPIELVEAAIEFGSSASTPSSIA